MTPPELLIRVLTPNVGLEGFLPLRADFCQRYSGGMST